MTESLKYGEQMVLEQMDLMEKKLKLHDHQNALKRKEQIERLTRRGQRRKGQEKEQALTTKIGGKEEDREK